MVFPVEMETGSYLEYQGAGSCKLYGPQGNLINEVTPQGDAPMLAAGDNAVQFGCDAAPGVSSRACITVGGRGEPIAE